MMETNNFLVKIGFKILVLFVPTKVSMSSILLYFNYFCLSSFILKSLIPVPKSQKIFSPNSLLQNTAVQMMLPPAGTVGLINLAFT